MSHQTIRPGLRAATGDDQPAPAPQPPPRSPWPDPPQVPPSGPSVAPDVDLDDERWRDAQPMRYPGHARIIDRDPNRPGTYTVLLDRCLCGAVVGECECPALVATLPRVPVYTLPARPAATTQAYRVGFASIPDANVPAMTATVGSDAELAVRVYRYLRPFFCNPDIEVALCAEMGTGTVWDGLLIAGTIKIEVAR